MKIYSFNFVPGVPEFALYHRIDMQDLSLGIRDKDQVIHRLEKRTEINFALRELCFHLFPLANIDKCNYSARYLGVFH